MEATIRGKKTIHMCNNTVSNNWLCQLHNATLVSDQSHSWSTLIQVSVLPEDVSLRADPLSLLSRSTTTRSHTVEMCRYLVIPHADVGPDVVVDYRLLFVFRLRTHKIKFLTGWSSCSFWLREMFSESHSEDAVSAAVCLRLHSAIITSLCCVLLHINGWAVNGPASLNIISGITVLISKSTRRVQSGD